MANTITHRESKLVFEIMNLLLLVDEDVESERDVLSERLVDE